MLILTPKRSKVNILENIELRGPVVFPAAEHRPSPACVFSQLRVSCGLMGAKSQNRPKNLAQKLLQIRNALGLSQSEMLRCLGAQDSFSAARISEYETGAREPSLWMLLNYGRVARIHVEALIDDNATLPNRLPGNFSFRRLQQRVTQTSKASHNQK